MLNEDDLEAFLNRDHWLPKVTPEAVGDALVDFPLSVVGDVSLGWLAAAIRRGLSFTVPSGDNDPARASNAKLRSRMLKLAGRLRADWKDAFSRDEGTDNLLFWSAFKHWNGKNALGAASDPAFEYNRLA